MNKIIKKTIAETIINKNDLFRIINLVYSEYKDIAGENKYFKINITCDSDESYEYEDFTIQEDDIVLDTKRILSIQVSLRFDDYKKSRKVIIIYLSQKNVYWNDSHYQIEGNDEDRVNSQNHKLTDIISSFIKQKALFRKYSWVIVFCILLGLIFLSLRRLLSNPFIISLLKDNSLLIIIISFVVGLIILLPGYKMTQYLESLRPCIEFDFGPTHKKHSKNRRIFIRAFISLIGSGIIGNIIQVLLSYFFSNT